MTSNGNIYQPSKWQEIDFPLREKPVQALLSSKLDHFCKDIYEGTLFQIVYTSVL